VDGGRERGEERDDDEQSELCPAHQRATIYWSGHHPAAAHT
jgi:hypothetical protein